MIGSAVRSRDPILVLVLTGVVVGSLLGAGVGLVKYLADPYNQLPAMTFWLLGSLAGDRASPISLPLFGPVALGTVVLVALRWRMNVMSLPEEEARALGVADRAAAHRHRRGGNAGDLGERRRPPASSAGSAWWCRIWRARWSGPDFARLLPAAALLGGGYLLLIDTLARTMAPVEIPLGILTAVVGTPFFIWLLASVQKNWS